MGHLPSKKAEGIPLPENMILSMNLYAARSPRTNVKASSRAGQHV
jgi:hypothetical protein